MVLGKLIGKRVQSIKRLSTTSKFSPRDSFSELPLIRTSKKPLFPRFQCTQIIKNAQLIKLIQNQIRNHTPFVAVFMQHEEKLINKQNQLWKVGTLALLQENSNTNDELNINLCGLDRIQIVPSMVSRISSETILADVEKFNYLDFERGNYFDALTMTVVQSIREIIDMDAKAAELFLNGIMDNRENFHNIEFLCDLSACITRANEDQLKSMMEEADIPTRMKLALEFLKMAKERIELRRKIVDNAQKSLEEKQEKLILCEQMNAIKKEIGIKNEKNAVIDKYLEIAEQTNLPDVIRDEFNTGISTLKNLHIGCPEFYTANSYLDWIARMPWGKYTQETMNLTVARTVLDLGHFGMDDVKTRILEFIAVANLKGSAKGKILCLHGAPGVGKTSIAKSIAKALNRRFHSINVGGLCQVAELKGHRRTYVGALPGKIVQTLSQVNSFNPVILIDEIDKIGLGTFDGQPNPASVLLEIFDPEQNTNYVDHYLDVPIDLSNVLFICAGNDLNCLPAPLLDRMELIPMNGYTNEEKFIIAKKFMIPNLIKDNGFQANQLSFDDTAIQTLIDEYCYEAGVRNLKMKLEKLIQKIAFEFCTGKVAISNITERHIRTYMGPSNDYKYQMPDNWMPPGIATGLAYTTYGGDILYIETARTMEQSSATNLSTTPQIKLTGQLGPVMRNSANIALTFAQNFIHSIDPSNRILECNEIHIHVPKLCIPKEGPSAGMAIATALISLALNKSIAKHTAMTGSLTLYGKIMPVGGIKEKMLAAKRNNINSIILSRLNQRDIDELPSGIVNQIQTYYVDDYKEVYDILFGK